MYDLPCPGWVLAGAQLTTVSHIDIISVSELSAPTPATPSYSPVNSFTPTVCVLPSTELQLAGGRLATEYSEVTILPWLHQPVACSAPVQDTLLLHIKPANSFPPANRGELQQCHHHVFVKFSLCSFIYKNKGKCKKKAVCCVWCCDCVVSSKTGFRCDQPSSTAQPSTLLLLLRWPHHQQPTANSISITLVICDMSSPPYWSPLLRAAANLRQPLKYYTILFRNFTHKL